MKLLNSTLVHDGFLKVFKNTYQTGEQTLVREVLERKDSVAALVYNMDTNLYCFISQPRPATFGKTDNSDNFIEIVAGVIDEGETPEEAVTREVIEETGFLTIDTVHPVGEFFLSPGGCSEKLYFFIVLVTDENKQETKGVEDENIKLVFLTLPEVEKMTFYDAKTIIAKYYLLNA